MHTTDLVHRPSASWPRCPAFERPTLAPSYYELITPVRSAILRARQYLLDEHRRDGSWLGRQSGDASIAGRLVLLLAFLESDESELAEQAANAIRADQRPDGGWSRRPDGPADASASVEAYFALKIVGDDPSQPHMRRARQTIRRLGGADAAEATTRWWLALLGQVDYECCTPVAPEWLLLPTHWQRRMFGGEMSWADRRRRTALAAIWALRPQRFMEPARGVRELFVEPPQHWPPQLAPATRWTRAWAFLSRLCERAGLVPFRPRSLALAEVLLARDALEADIAEIGFTELIWQIVALRSCGNAPASAELAACEARLRQLVVVDGADAARPQPTTNSLSDTIQSLTALAASGVSPIQPIPANAAAWLVDKFPSPASVQRIESAMDLALLLAALESLTREPGSTSALPPDIQLVPDRMARFLARHRGRAAPRSELQRLAQPVCDALVLRLRATDAPDVTGAALEALVDHGLPSQHHAISAGAALLRATQGADGGWASASADESVRATAWAVRGLIAAGAGIGSLAVAAGVNWLCANQLDSGGWGDAPQTADAVLALVAAGAADHDAARRGIAFLLECHERQSDDDEYLDLSATAATLLALARWAVAAAAAEHRESTPACLRLVGEELFT